MRHWLRLVLLACATGAAHAEEFTARVIVVLDGDTVLVVRNCNSRDPKAPVVHLAPSCGDNKPVRIRLADIDAPEKEQPGGKESASALTAMVLKKRVRVNVGTADKYGRLVAQLELDGASVNAELVRRGMAWEYSSYHSNKAYIALQQSARLARIGLWAQADPVAPWEWRKLHTADAPTPAHVTGHLACGKRRHCAQMRSCAEARFYLTECGIKSLDGDGDGVPCESLCGETERP